MLHNQDTLLAARQPASQPASKQASTTADVAKPTWAGGPSPACAA